MEKSIQEKYTTYANLMEIKDMANEPEVVASETVSDHEIIDTALSFPEHLEGKTGPDGQKLLNKSKHIHKHKHFDKKSVKDKEKARRMKGQSSIATWKPDMYMKLRQEFD